MILIAPDQVLDIVRILYGGLTAIILIFGAELLVRYFNADKQTRTDPAYLVFLTIACAVIGYGLYMGLIFVNYGLISALSATEGTRATQWLFVILILVPMSLISERIVFKKNNAWISTVIGFTITNYAIILTILEYIDGTIDTSLLFIPVFLAFIVLGVIAFLGLLMIFFVRLKSQKRIKRNIILAFIWGAFAFTGSFYGASGRAVNTIVYIIGTVIEIIGWIGTRHYLLSIPSYGALQWRRGIKELHIMEAASGAPIFYKAFQPIITSVTIPKALKATELDVNLASGTVEANLMKLKTVINEITGVNAQGGICSMGNQAVFYWQGETILILLIVEENLGVYATLVEKVGKAVESAMVTKEGTKVKIIELNFNAIIERVFELRGEL